MNVLTTTWRQLVRRRLWPVAVLLLAALVAVPVLLAREPAAPEPLAPLPTSVEADDTIAEPVVAELAPEDRSRRRRVLGVRKDPFSPAPVKKADAKPTPTATPDGGGGPAGGGESGGGGGGSTVTGGEPAPEPTYYDAGTIIVRFGTPSADGQLERFAIRKFEGLPDNEFPLLVYMGLTKNGKKAKFLVDDAVEVDGDGVCKPHRSSCETIELAVGETEFLDVINPAVEDDSEDEGTEEADAEAEPEIIAQFQLDLVDIKRAGDDDVR